jgi:WD40 repeat protein
MGSILPYCELYQSTIDLIFTRLVAAGSLEGTVSIMKCSNNFPVTILNQSKFVNSDQDNQNIGIHVLEFSPTGTLLAIGDYCGRVILYDILQNVTSLCCFFDTF